MRRVGLIAARNAYKGGTREWLRGLARALREQMEWLEAAR